MKVVSCVERSEQNVWCRLFVFTVSSTFSRLSSSPLHRGPLVALSPPGPVPTSLAPPQEEAPQTHQQISHQSHDHVELQVRERARGHNEIFYYLSETKLNKNVTKL